MARLEPAEDTNSQSDSFIPICNKILLLALEISFVSDLSDTNVFIGRRRRSSILKK